MTNPSFNASFNALINPSFDASFNALINPSFDASFNRSINALINPSINASITTSIHAARVRCARHGEVPGRDAEPILRTATANLVVTTHA